MVSVEEMTMMESTADEVTTVPFSPPDVTPQPVEPELDIFHGESVTDRKSTFQAHVVEVHSVNEVHVLQASCK